MHNILLIRQIHLTQCDPYSISLNDVHTLLFDTKPYKLLTSAIHPAPQGDVRQEHEQ